MAIDPREMSVLISMGRRGLVKGEDSPVMKRVLLALGPEARRIADLLRGREVESPTRDEQVAVHVLRGQPVPEELKRKQAS